MEGKNKNGKENQKEEEGGIKEENKTVSVAQAIAGGREEVKV